jgi:hypothetical protein
LVLSKITGNASVTVQVSILPGPYIAPSLVDAGVAQSFPHLETLRPFFRQEPQSLKRKTLRYRLRSLRLRQNAKVFAQLYLTENWRR